MRPDCNRNLKRETKKLRLLLLIREMEAGAREKITQAQMAEELGVTERYARELIRLLRTEGKIRTWNAGPLRDEKGRFVKVARANEEPHFIGTPLQYFFPEQLSVRDEIDAVDGRLSRRPLGTEMPNQRHVENSSVPSGGSLQDSDLQPESVGKEEFGSGALSSNYYLNTIKEPEVIFEEIAKTTSEETSPEPHTCGVSGEGKPAGSQPRINGTAESGATAPSHPVLDLIPILRREIEEMTEELLT